MILNTYVQVLGASKDIAYDISFWNIQLLINFGHSVLSAQTSAGSYVRQNMHIAYLGHTYTGLECYCNMVGLPHS